jgi:hypothetical protein
MVEELRKNWDKIFQLAVWLASIVLLVVVSPPRFLASDPLPDTAIKAGELFLAICVGLCFFIFQSADQKNVRSRYALAGAAMVLVGMTLFLIYQFEFEAWTCSYDARGPVTIGTNMLPEAAEYMRQHPEATCEYLIQVSGGQVEKIWPKSEIIAHHLGLIATFLFSIVSLSLAALFVTFAIARTEERSPAT